MNILSNTHLHLLLHKVELCVVIGQDCKNISADEDPLKYVLGYTAGNDVSSRYWQFSERSGGQPGYAKSFDKFAPIGPILCSPSVITDPHVLSLKTVVNGQIRQSSNTDDLIFDVRTLIRHLSRGKTLRKGTIIMTGTPGGVAAFMKPPGWLNDGDIVEIEIEGIGRLRNKMVYEK
jgi:2-keto-4-pentenoate hydratase/2-oxohepta-3-ene-1,7-dioic acid hydratase in catechol pathway